MYHFILCIMSHRYIAMELCVGTLKDLVEGTLKEDLKGRGLPSPGPNEEILRQITSGLQFLHSKQIVHRDIKPINILISDKGIVKLTDFGLCKEKKEGATGFSFTGNVGSLDWAAPELLELRRLKEEGSRVVDSKFKFAVDVFSLGCVFCYVLTGGKHPFGDDYYDRIQNIRTGESTKNNFDSK